MKKAFRITISGQVQGVSFRLNAKRQADELNLTGFARNLPAGTVEIEIEGEPENLSRFIEWCQAGPRHASVQKVQLNSIPLSNRSSFSTT